MSTATEPRTRRSADGTSIVTSSEDNKLRTFVLPVDLLDATSSPQDLAPYAAISAPEPVYATALHPYFNLQDPSTTLLLSSPRAHPIALHSALHPSPLLASYPLIHGPTETYLTPHSLLWTSAGTHFLAGSNTLISLFDAARSGAGPVSSMPTIPSRRKKIVGGGVGIKGIVSAMGVSGEGLLAAGTFTRCVGLYDAEGSGECVALFEVGADDDGGQKGMGITQVLWSPCGRYLFVAERKSEGIWVYDVRVTGKRLATLNGRRAASNQRLGMEVLQARAGCEVWAGGIDGVVRVWEAAEKEEGDKEPTRSWKAHDDPVTSTIVHSSGSVVATCSGQRRFPDDGVRETNDEGGPRTSSPLSGSPLEASGVKFDNSLKIWKL
ncbi:MAG: hypothetical protein M1833_001033 [Piccolia ochrophora]|nr:MAG: hypothetical protein M1833_001033 [Piccolia ochrophora]